MSLTVIQRFYELAKEKAEAPGLGMTFGGNDYQLPWWIIKSKAKHFGLGLLECGAETGECFYLLPTSHPHWVYAELGALTIGLRTIPLPRQISADDLDELLERHPPAFVFLGDESVPILRTILQKRRALKKIIFSVETKRDLKLTPEEQTDFRRIFNSGIRNESKHHQQYRKRRQELKESDMMSPIRVNPEGRIEYRPLLYADVNRLASQLTQLCHLRKIKRYFVQADLGYTMERVVGLYWPIYLGMQTVYHNESRKFLEQLRASKPTLAFLKKETLEQALAELSAKTPVRPSFIHKALFRYKIQKTLGRRLRAVLTTETLSLPCRDILKMGKVRSLVVEQ
jgi:long-subunit acyl-CoA synthetase (AMP-forming)